MTALRQDPSRRLAAEFLGTALLLVAVVGSGIATSVDGAASTQLFQHAAVVGATLVALILALGPVSGAHINPAVTVAAVLLDALPRHLALPYVLAQVTGAITGTIVANAMFGLDPVAFGATARAGGTLWGSELVATAGLVAVIFGIVRAGNERAVPGAVGAWVFGAIFFTSSMCFANPAVTIARLFTASWTAILPAHVPTYVVAQLAGTGVAVLGVRWLWMPEPDQPRVTTAPTPDPTRVGRPARQELPPSPHVRHQSH